MEMPSGPGVSIRDRVLAAIRQCPNMTEIEIEEAVRGGKELNPGLRNLLADGVIERQGNGGPTDPYRYRIKPNA